MNDVSRKTILIVDDEEDLRELLVNQFQLHGCRTLGAENGRSALQQLMNGHVDLVISDIRMPGGDGITMLKEIRRRFGLELPVVLITGFADITSLEARRLGATGIFSKPFDMDALEQSVLGLLARKAG